MQVTLIDYTGKGSPDPARAAANLLVFTKQTRLKLTPNLMSEVENWSDMAIMKELEYMAKTIPSSWEFVTYTFLITGVTRAFTHQFVRTRTGSYAQQTMRVLEMDEWTYGTGPSIAGNEHLESLYDLEMKAIDTTYKQLLADGAKAEDARGILPTNIHTNIVAKFDLRTFSDTQRKRASVRTQGEYRDVLNGMRAVVLAAHPWAAMFIDRSFDKAAAELERQIKELADDVDGRKLSMIKLLDELRQTA
jgi:flavin-dependent thymidylate synthase